MLDKLEQIHAEVIETRKQVNVVEQLIRAIADFINSIVAAFGGGQVKPIMTSVITSVPNTTENVTGP
jgi:hypothetical protein